MLCAVTARCLSRATEGNNPNQALIKEVKIQFQPPNPDFIFHNKLPKSGSSTMNQIFTVLSEWNKFHHFKLNGNAMRKHGDRMKGFSDEGLFQFAQGSPWR